MTARDTYRRWRTGATLALVTVICLTGFEPVRCSIIPPQACRFIDTFNHAPTDFDFLSKVALSLTLSQSSSPSASQDRT